LGTGLIVHHRTVSAVKRVEFVSDTMSYTVLRGRWCNITVLHQVRIKVITQKTVLWRIGADFLSFS